MTRPYGMAQRAFEAYIQACYTARIDPERTHQGGRRIVQTIGDAPASAGVHEQDGVDEYGHDYCAAVDISVVHDLSPSQIDELLMALAANGFAAWWRHTGSFADNVHVHAVYAGVMMKGSLRVQIHDFLAHRNGLATHADDRFWIDNLSEHSAQHIRDLFLEHNPMNG